MPPKLAGRPRPGLAPVVGGALLLIVLTVAIGVASPGAGASPNHPPSAPALATLARSAAASNPNASRPGIHLAISGQEPAICLGQLANCPSEAATDTITLSATVGPSAWPAVQMLFLLETTPYDGVYDPSAGAPGGDPCGDGTYGTGTLCEEANGVPFFAANAASIATSIAAAHPTTNFSFGLLDFFATQDAFDAGGGTYYHVDVGNFVNASGFGPAVGKSLTTQVLSGGYILPNSDLRENFLHSSSISALFGGLEGAGVNWSAAAHHVLVIIGSTAPRDPNYLENYCVSPAVTPDGLANCTAPTCEPSNLLPGELTVPACEGWVTSNSTNRSADIASLAKVAPDCVGSYGARCTIDAIDLYDTPTDPESPSWSASGGSGGPANWTLDSDNILRAGCDIAAATGGSWDGPSWFSCPNGPSGDLPLVGHGAAAAPNVSNPALLRAMVHLSLGDPSSVLPIAAAPNRPIFLFVPFGQISVAVGTSFVQSCANATGVAFPCPGPTATALGGTVAFGWNISTIPASNGLQAGDTWSSTFQVADLGPPVATVPVDACILRDCQAAGSGAVLGNFTESTFRFFDGSLVTALSFPVAVVQAELALTSAIVTPPSAPPLGAGGGTPGAGGTPPPTATPPPGPSVPAPAVAVQTFTAGIIAAGAIRLGVRGTGLSQKTAAQSGALGAKKRGAAPTHVGRWV